MSQLTAYSFRDGAFSPDGDTHVCVVELDALKVFIQDELDAAFSGHVVYRRGLLRRYVGVWGRRNAKRLRRFLSERGAVLTISRTKPIGAKLALFVTKSRRERVRTLGSIAG